MKKILTSLALVGALVGVSVTSHAQDRTVDLQLISTVLDGDTLIIDSVNPSSTIIYTGFVNNGPDNLMEGDSLHWITPYGASYYYILGATDTLDMGDTLGYFTDTVALSNGPATGDATWCDSAWASAEEGTITDPDPDPRCVSVYLLNRNGSTGILDVAHKKVNLNVYPNPTSDKVSITYNFESATNASIQVTDVTGRVVINKDLGKQTTGQKIFNLDVSALSNGIYTVQLITDNARGISKLTVRK